MMITVRFAATVIVTVVVPVVVAEAERLQQDASDIGYRAGHSGGYRDAKSIYNVNCY